MNINLLRTTSANPHFRGLVRLLDLEQRVMYAELMDMYDAHNVIKQLDTVVVAYLNDVPIGCGCFKPFDEEAVEVKRMFVYADARGKGISKLILGELETWAHELGFAYTVLETGSKNISAQHLYRKSGYAEIPKYVPYVDLPDSICMRKRLD